MDTTPDAPGDATNPWTAPDGPSTGPTGVPGPSRANSQNPPAPPLQAPPLAPPPAGPGAAWGTPGGPASAPPGWWLASDGRWYPPQSAPLQAPPATPYPYGGYSTAARTNGMAIASMVLGILWLYWVGSILALVFGYIARRAIDESRGTQGGRGMATAGIVLGWVGVGILCVFFLFGFIAAIGSSS